MFISHRHHFLFVHIAKTGGTSIRAALARDRWLDPWVWPTFVCHRFSGLTRHRIGCKIPRHAPIAVAEGMLPPDYFHLLFKFAFVRNPWDRMVSAYGHFQREHPSILAEHGLECFSRFARWTLFAPLETLTRPALVMAIRRPQYDHLINARSDLVVDYVGRFECLERDFRAVQRQLGLRESKLSHRRRGRAATDFRLAYDDRLAEEVGDHFQRDVTAFDYAFDTSGASLREPPIILPIERGLAQPRASSTSLSHGPVREVS